MNIVKQNFSYLKSIANYGILYGKGHNIDLEVFVNVDWVGDIEFRRSTWYGKRQAMVALSSTKTKYCALMEGTKEVYD